MLEYIPIPGQCCSGIKRVGCKEGDHIYKPGEKWHIEDDFCTEYECIITPNGGVQKKTHEITCDASCDVGWEYVNATKESQQCCGFCKAFACVVDGILHNIDEEWTSEDYCTNYYCLNVNGSVSICHIFIVNFLITSCWYSYKSKRSS